MSRFIADIPVLTTERLRLRGHRLEDFEAYFALWRQPGVVRYTLAHPATREEAWRRFLGLAGHWPLMGFGWWAIEDKAGGEFLGEVGLFDYKRDMTPSIEGEIEMGWGLADRAAGRGLATEAGRAAIHWAERNLGGQALVCMIDLDNTHSVRVADKLGFKEFARTRYKDKPVILYRRQGRQ